MFYGSTVGPEVITVCDTVEASYDPPVVVVMNQIFPRPEELALDKPGTLDEPGTIEGHTRMLGAVYEALFAKVGASVRYRREARPAFSMIGQQSSKRRVKTLLTGGQARPA